MKFRTTVDVVESMSSELYVYFDVKSEEVQSAELQEVAADAGMEALPSRVGAQPRRTAACPASAPWARGAGDSLAIRSLKDGALEPVAFELGAELERGVHRDVGLDLETSAATSGPPSAATQPFVG